MSTPRFPRLLALSCVFALALLAACAQDARDLVPFNCALDLTCPAGTLCLPSGSADAGPSCVLPQAEALCKLDGDCAELGAKALCDQGRCRLVCADGTGCAAGETCSAAKGAGVCLQGCPAGVCPGALECASLLPAGAQVCLAKGQGLAKACDSAGADCGPKGANLKCSESHVCSATCTGGTGCAAGYVCSDGKAAGLCLKACTGTPPTCTTGVCAPLWYGSATACLPTGTGLETPCTTEGARCGPEGSASVCRGARCLAACSGGDSTDCPTGESCSASTGAGVCAKDCTAGAVCPADLVCSGPFSDTKRRCVPKALALGSQCSGIDGTACGLPGQGATCQYNICAAQTCTDGAGCQAGTFCSAATGPGACLIDCTGGASCPGDLACRDWFDGTHKACLNVNAGVGGTCATEGQACGPAGSRGLCKGLRCLLSCDPVSAPTCPGGSACSTTSGPGVCLVDCSSSNDLCPGDLVCTGPTATGVRQCTPPGSGIGDTCTTPGACGMPGQGASCVEHLCALPCTAGAGCRAGSFCSSSTGSGVCLEDCSAVGKTCAEKLTCLPSFDGVHKACVPAALALDSPCASDGAACGTPGSNGICAAGVCAPACPNATCTDPTRVCSRPAPGEGGGCLTDCTSNATLCTAPLACGDLWYSGKSGCGVRAMPACVAAAPSSTCNLCGNREAWNVACGTGFCADNTNCVNNGTSCQCKPGFDLVDCTGTPCSGSCVYPNWWCRPQAAPQMTCDGVPTAVTGTCTCADGRQPNVACGTANSLTCDYLCSLGCDPTIASSCTSPTKSRCQLVAGASDDKPACVAPGASNLGQSAGCTPTQDDCIPPLTCSNTGTLRTQARCMRYCSSTSACPLGGQCLRVSTSAPPYGVCTAQPACAAFSTSCGVGNTCALAARLVTRAMTTVCRTAGSMAAGAICASNYDCGANLLCATTSASAGKTICTPLCDSAHACTGALTCSAFGVSAQPSFGYCK